MNHCSTPIASFGPPIGRKRLQQTNMDWRHKMRKAWFAVSSRFKFRKSGSGGGAACRSSCSLLKLQDDVQMCGYRDVEVMWNMFIESNPEKWQQH